MIKDSLVVRLQASFATKRPATRSRKVATGVKVDLLVSVCANGPKSVALVGERTHDVKLLRLGAWVKNRILLADLGITPIASSRGSRSTAATSSVGGRRARTRSSFGR